MKKNYIFTLILTLCFSALSFGQVIITELADPNNDAAARYVEIYNAGSSSVDMTNWSLKRYTNASTTTSSNVVDLTPLGNLASGAFSIIAANGTNFQTVYGVAADISAGTGGPADSNGDDQIALFNASDTLVDIFGVPGEDGNANGGTCHEFEDGRAERKASATAANATWNEAEWNVWADSTISGCTSHTNSPRTSPTDFDPKAWIGASTSSEPTLAFNSPSDNQTFSSGTTTIPITFNIQNFDLSGDNGSEMTDNAGDGYIKGTLYKSGVLDGTQSIFSGSVTQIDNAVDGEVYMVTAELVDNAGNSLSPKVEVTANFSVLFPCDLVLGDIITTCDAITSGLDSYNGTIAFTGGNTGTSYTITVPNGVTVGGDNPDTTEAGTITFSGMTEGVDASIIVVGGTGSSCDFSETLPSPVCVSFPVIEHFDYTDASTLGNQNAWTILNSGDEMLVTAGNLDYPGLEASTGNKITFDETGSETYTAFSDVTTGTVYASFLLKVTGFQTGTSVDVTDGGYIAALAGSTSGYDARFWVRPNPDTSGTSFDIGFGVESSNPTFTEGTYDLNDVVFVVMAYNMDDAIVSTWINPDASSFEGTIPTATITGTDASAPSAINLFVLRQDSNNETPFIELDALRISTSWADVTPNDATASITNNSIEGFETFPNPVTNNRFTISSNSNSKKELVIFNVLGKKVLTSSFLGTKSNVDVSAISSGIYILKVTEEGKTATKKLVIR
jgi:hypothetical protein